MSNYSPLNPDDKEHQKASARAQDYNVGVFIQPLVNGEFPKSVLDAFEQTNKEEDLKIRRLIQFTNDEKKDLIGSYDFIGVNFYSATKVKPKTGSDISTNLNAKDMDFISDPVDMDDTDETSKGFYRLIDYLRNKCNDPVLFITENGYCEKPNEKSSLKKIKYHHGILTALHLAIMKGAKIKGYTAWSFMDSFEWGQGYNTSLYGIYSVDFSDEKKRPRSDKPSTQFFRELFQTKTLPSITQYSVI